MKTFQHKAARRRRAAYIHQLFSWLFIGGCIGVLLSVVVANPIAKATADCVMVVSYGGRC